MWMRMVSAHGYIVQALPQMVSVVACIAFVAHLFFWGSKVVGLHCPRGEFRAQLTAGALFGGCQYYWY
mgnify:CR=1 FL=1